LCKIHGELWEQLRVVYVEDWEFAREEEVIVLLSSDRDSALPSEQLTKD